MTSRKYFFSNKGMQMPNPYMKGNWPLPSPNLIEAFEEQKYNHKMLHAVNMLTENGESVIVYENEIIPWDEYNKWIELNKPSYGK